MCFTDRICLTCRVLSIVFVCRGSLWTWTPCCTLRRMIFLKSYKNLTPCVVVSKVVWRVWARIATTMSPNLKISLSIVSNCSSPTSITSIMRSCMRCCWRFTIALLIRIKFSINSWFMTVGCWMCPKWSTWLWFTVSSHRIKPSISTLSSLRRSFTKPFPPTPNSMRMILTILSILFIKISCPWSIKIWS